MAVKCAAQLAQGCAAQQQRTSCANDNKTSGIFSNTPTRPTIGSFKLLKYRKVVVKTIFKHEKSAQGSKKKVLSSGIFLGVL